MAFVVEDGSGVVGANAYVGIGFVHSYLHARGLATSWDAATVTQRKQWIVESTDYLENRWAQRFNGQKSNTDLIISAYNYLNIVAVPTELDTFSIGDVTYRFMTTVTTAYDITIGADINETTTNIIAAINASGTNDVEYATGTLINADVTAVASDDGSIKLTSKLVGSLGNETTAMSSSNESSILFDYDDLYNGDDEGEQDLSFPRDYIYSQVGNPITGVPNKIKYAIAELAYRAQSGRLMADPVVDATGMQVTKTFDKVGPIEQERVYIGGSQQSIFKKFPTVENLVKEFLSSSGGVIR